MKIAESERLFTQCGRDITKRVNDGLTSVIPGIGLKTERLAEAMATEQRRYSYPVYVKHNGKLKQYGYAIPH